MTLNKFGEHLTGGIMSIDKFGKHTHGHGISKHMNKSKVLKQIKEDIEQKAKWKTWQILELWSDGKEVEPGVYNITNKARTSLYVNEIFSGKVVKVMLYGNNVSVSINNTPYVSGTKPITLKVKDTIQLTKRFGSRPSTESAATIVLQLENVEN